MSQRKGPGNGNVRLSAVPSGATEGRVSRPPFGAPAKGTKMDGGKYVVDRLLGSGGMGVVVLAHHSILRREVAIKILPTEVVDGLVDKKAQDEAKKRLRNEARIQAAVKSPHIVEVLDYFEDASGFSLVMPFMEKGDLGQLLGTPEKPTKLPIQDVVRYLSKIANGLDHLHGRGIIHRDIKPENILLEEVDGCLEPRIADAGVAAVTRGNNLGITVTSTTTSGLIGTPLYISPEVISYRDADARSDIYSLAVLVYQMLTGRVPFDAKSMQLVMRQHLEDHPPSIGGHLPTFPVEVERVVLKALAKDPDNRYQTAGAFAGAFSAALATSGYAERSLSETLDVNADTVHASTPPAERLSASAPTPQTAAIHLERRRRRTTPVRGNTIHPKPTSWWVIVPLMAGVLLFGGVTYWFISGSVPAVENVADSAVEAEQAAPVAQQEEPPAVLVPAPLRLATAPLPTQRPAAAVVSPQDSRLCTEVVLGVRRMSPDVREACQRYCAASDRTDQVRIKAIRRGYCR